MPFARAALIGVALLAGAATTARAQQRPARWAGDGTRSRPATNQSHSHVAYRGPVVIVDAAPFPGPNTAFRNQPAGGSWDGRRPTAAGSPAAQVRQGTTDLSGFFGYVPPRGEAPERARIEPARRVTEQPVTRPTRDTVQHHPRIYRP